MSDLSLTSSIFEATNKSLLKIAKDYERLLSRQFDDNLERPIKNEKLLFERSSHQANAEWHLFNSIYISLLATFEDHLSNIAKHIE